jgi:ParB-like chromosome segregation protein Spo0J
MNKQNFKVDFMDITAVIPYEENPRQIGPDAVSKVAKSIKKYGFVSPNIVNDENVVLAGHTRLQAAISLGLEQVPVHTKSGLSEAAQRAYRLADNRVAEESQWDFPMLTEELEFLKGDDFDLR